MLKIRSIYQPSKLSADAYHKFYTDDGLLWGKVDRDQTLGIYWHCSEHYCNPPFPRLIKDLL